MTRVKRGFVARKRRQTVFKLTKGFRGSSSILFRTANQRAMKALKYAYRDRRTKKRTYRQLWISRINSASRSYETSYSSILHLLKQKKVLINRKTLSQLAVLDPLSFEKLLNCFN